MRPSEYISGVHDVMAAEMLATASETEPEAAALSDSLNDMLGASYICRQRAHRLNNAAIRATYAGEHGLSALVARFAADSDSEADEHEAVAGHCVRGMHSFGYYSPTEMKMLGRKGFMEGASQAQAEAALGDLSQKLMQDSMNFGMDPDGAGSEREPEEMGGQGCAGFGVVADVLGGDVPAVFGTQFYDAFGKLFAPSMKRLKKRQARLRKRLERLNDKLEGLEDSGKSGLRVRVLQKRIDVIESRLEKIAEKIESLQDSSKKVRRSRAQAEVIESAEQSSMDSNFEDDLPPNDDDLLNDDDDEFGLMAEVEVFGLSARRVKRIKRRIQRLSRRLQRLNARNRGPLRERRIASIQKRIEKLQAKLDAAESDSDLDDLLFDDDIEEESYTASLVTPQVKAYTQDEWLASFSGSLAADPSTANRKPYVQFFRRKSEARGGSANLSPEVMGQANDGFFASIANFFRNLFTPERREVRRDRRQAAAQKSKAYVQQRVQSVKARRTAARQARLTAREKTDLVFKMKAARRARATVRRAGRRAFFQAPNGQRVRRPAPSRVSLPDGEYFDTRGNGYGYIVQDGVLSVVTSGNAVFNPPRLPPGGQEVAMRNLKADLAAGHIETSSTVSGSFAGRPVPLPRRKMMRRRAMKRRALQRRGVKRRRMARPNMRRR